MTAAGRATVYGTLMNFQGELESLGPKMDDVPYKGPPKAPVLYLKPANTWSENGAAIALPAHVPEVEIGATVAVVMGSDSRVAGYVLMNDLSMPHDSFFRPPVKFKCLDGFLGIGGQVVAPGVAGDPDAFTLEVRINGVLRQTVRFAQLVRSAGQLLADVGAFMTLGPGDMLMLGCDVGRPRARVGDRIEITAPTFGSLVNALVAEAA